MGYGLLSHIALCFSVSWASNHLVNYIYQNQGISLLKKVTWLYASVLLLALGCLSLPALGTDKSSGGESLCANTPSCYAESHRQPIKSCRQVIEAKTDFRFLWTDLDVKPLFSTYLWHDEGKRIIQAFGNNAVALNSVGMQIPLKYFCIFNANTGEVIAASLQ